MVTCDISVVSYKNNKTRTSNNENMPKKAKIANFDLAQIPHFEMNMSIRHSQNSSSKKKKRRNVIIE